MFALDSDTARLLTEQFTQGKVQKTYLAIVRGHTPEQGHIDHALKEQLDRIADADADQNKAAQTALSDYQRCLRFEIPIAVDRYPTSRYSLVEVQPKTGRKHQIRRHMKHISHHIIGDTTHGNGKHNRFFREQFDCQRLLLHAQSLQLTHPHSHEALHIQAPLTPDLVHIVAQLDQYRL